MLKCCSSCSVLYAPHLCERSIDLVHIYMLSRHSETSMQMYPLKCQVILWLLSLKNTFPFTWSLLDMQVNTVTYYHQVNSVFTLG